MKIALCKLNYLHSPQRYCEGEQFFLPLANYVLERAVRVFDRIILGEICKLMPTRDVAIDIQTRSDRQTFANGLDLDFFDESRGLCAFESVSLAFKLSVLCKFDGIGIS